MEQATRIGGLDQRFAPKRAGAARSAVLVLFGLLGAAAGVFLASQTAPHPHCTPGDGMCRLQKLYLAQAVKVLGCTLAAWVVTETIVVRIPNRLMESRRRAAYAVAHPAPAPVLPSATFDASTARTALSAVNQSATLPPAALRALEARRADQLRAMGPSLLQQARSTTSDPAEAARIALAAVNARTALPPAALAALAGRGTGTLGGAEAVRTVPPSIRGAAEPAVLRPVSAAAVPSPEARRARAHAVAPPPEPLLALPSAAVSHLRAVPDGPAGLAAAFRRGEPSSPATVRAVSPAPRRVAAEVMEEIGRGPSLPPAALEALLAEGPSLGRRPPGRRAG